jgi:hypothetical protein
VSSAEVMHQLYWKGPTRISTPGSGTSGVSSGLPLSLPPYENLGSDALFAWDNLCQIIR